MRSTRQLRFAALGDSTTCGIGDPVPGGWRGWARILADALATSYAVTECNVSVSGATAREVREQQLAQALAHRPHVASLVVGVNDTMRSTWDAGRLRDDVLACAAALDRVDALLLTVRFHDHGAAFGLPGVLRRPLLARIEAVNDVYDEVHRRFGGVRVDLAALPEVYRRDSWSVDRLHPSERGHRLLARAFAERLLERGLVFDLPALEVSGGHAPGWRRDLAWMAAQGAPWFARRARDLGPWAVRLAWTEVRQPARPPLRRQPTWP